MDTLRDLSFLQFGKDYQGARDNYIYIYALERGGSKDPPNLFFTGGIHLLRVPRNHGSIVDRSAYEFFAGLDADSNPIWTTNIAQRVPVFEDPNGVGIPGVSYNPGINRYLLTVAHGPNADGLRKLGLFDAPEPWGPWTTVEYNEDWGGYTGYWLGYYIPTKTPDWMSLDGKTIHLVFSGDDQFDSFNLLKATLNLQGTSPTPGSTSTPTSEPTSTLTPTPVESGLVVSNLSVASGKAYVWDTLAVGKKSYIDRDYTFSSIPLPYQGLSYLRTANGDKSRQDNPFITFDVNQNVTVYVVYDNRNPIPAWLSGFTDTGDDISGGGFPNQARVLAKDFPAGTIKLGGNENGGSMYNVIVNGQGSGPTSTPISISPTSTSMPEPTVIPTEPSPNPITLTFGGPNSVAQGEMFSMDVVAQNVPAPGLYGVQFEINYDPTLVSTSNLRATPNLSFVVLNNADNTIGKIRLVASFCLETLWLVLKLQKWYDGYSAKIDTSGG